MVLFQVIDILFAVLRDLVIVLHVEIVIWLLHNSDGISRAEYSLHFDVADNVACRMLGCFVSNRTFLCSQTRFTHESRFKFALKAF